MSSPEQEPKGESQLSLSHSSLPEAADSQQWTSPEMIVGANGETARSGEFRDPGDCEARSGSEVFPVLYLLLRRYLPSRFNQILVLFGICAIILVWRCVLVYGFHSPEFRTRIATDMRIDSILFGCILAIYGNPVLDKVKYLARWWMGLWLPLGIIGIAFTLIYREPQFRETFRYTIQGIGLFPIFITAIRYSDSFLFRWLNLNWIKFLGLTSYSLYLVHNIVLNALKTTSLPIVIQAILALGLSITIATAIYYFVDKPCAALRKAWSYNKNPL